MSNLSRAAIGRRSFAAAIVRDETAVLVSRAPAVAQAETADSAAQAAG